MALLLYLLRHVPTDVKERGRLIRLRAGRLHDRHPADQVVGDQSGERS
jgi:hypothetical protein